MFIRPGSWSQLKPPRQSGQGEGPQACIQLFGIGYEVDASFAPREVYLRIYPERPEQLEGGDLLGNLFRERGLEPYELLIFTREDLHPLQGNYTTAERNYWVNWDTVSAAPFDSEEERLHFANFTNQSPRLIYWDIETYSADGSFTDAHKPGDEVVAISFLLATYLEIKGYVYTTLPDLGEAGKAPYPVPLQVVSFPTEAEMLSSFFTVQANLAPQLQLTYNGDNYDKPYLVVRAELLGLQPSLSRISSLRGKTRTFTMPSNFPNQVKESAVEFLTPDTESLDMLLYFRRFRPDFPNYRLETVSQAYLGIGKTGFEIEELFRVVRERDPEGVRQLIDYSYTDSLLLRDLEEAARLIPSLTQACNLTRLTRQEILRLIDPEIISRIFTRHLPPFGRPALSFSPLTYLRAASPGLYRNVYRYSYKAEINQVGRYFLGPKLAAAVEQLPLPLQVKALHSSFVDPEAVGEVEDTLFKLPQGVIAFLPYEVWYFRGDLPGRAPPEAKEDLLLVKGEGKYVSVQLGQGGKITGYSSYGGKCPFCDPAEFPYKEQVFRNYLEDLLQGKVDPKGRRITSIDREPASQFLVKKKVRAPDPFASAGKKKETSLAGMVAAKGVQISTFLPVYTLRVVKDEGAAASRIKGSRSLIPKYYPGNSYFYPLLEEADIYNCPPIDVTFYLASVNKMLEELDSLDWVVPGSARTSG